MAREPYVYNPSKQIDKSFDDAAKGIDDAWKPIIENKIQGFNFIKEQIASQDKIKENLNRFNREELTKRSDELQRKTASLIRSKGAIDKAGLADIKMEMDALKSAEAQSRDAPAIINEYLNMAKSNAMYVKDLAGLSSSIMKAGFDKDLLFKSTSLSEHLDKEYYKSLNMPLLLTERVRASTKNRGVETPINYRDEMGNMIVGSYTKLPGTFFNEKTGQVEYEKGVDPNIPGSTIIDNLAGTLLSEKEAMVFNENNIGSASAFGISTEDEIKRLASDAYINGAIVKVKVTSAEDIANKAATADYNQQRAKGYGKTLDIAQQNADSREKSANASMQNANSSASRASTAEKELQAKIDGRINSGSKSSSEGDSRPKYVNDTQGFMALKGDINGSKVSGVSISKNGVVVKDEYGNKRTIKSVDELLTLRSSLSKEELTAYDKQMDLVKKGKTEPTDPTPPEPKKTKKKNPMD